LSTASTLRNLTAKELSARAKKKNIAGYHSMRKEELVQALVKAARADAARKRRKEKAREEEKASKAKKKTTRAAKKTPTTKAKSTTRKTTKKATAKKTTAKKTTARKKTTRVDKPAAKAKPKTRTTAVIQTVAARTGKPRNGTASGGNGTTKPQVSRKEKADPPARPVIPAIRKSCIHGPIPEAKNLASRADKKEAAKSDRLIVMVRDSYWLQVYWELTQKSIERARASLGQHWHGAAPTIRVYEMAADSSGNPLKNHIRDITIHGGVNNWYVDVQDPPKKYQAEIGYLTVDGRFHAVARSNRVTTPRPTSSEAFDENWADVARDYDRIYAMSGGYDDQQATGDLKDILEERLRRPMGSPMMTRFGGEIGVKRHELELDIDAEVIVHGRVEPGAHVTLRGQPVHMREDGSFSVRFALPDRRHVLPVVASSADGVEQRTVILAIDRNTKIMEPVIRDPGD